MNISYVSHIRASKWQDFKYDMEIEIAKQLKREDMVKRLEELKKKEIARYASNTE